MLDAMSDLSHVVVGRERESPSETRIEDMTPVLRKYCVSLMAYILDHELIAIEGLRSGWCVLVAEKQSTDSCTQ